MAGAGVTGNPDLSCGCALPGAGGNAGQVVPKAVIDRYFVARANTLTGMLLMAMLKEFKDFLLKQNVVALAIAVVVGTALNTLVKAVVDDFIMPIVVAIGPGGDWQKATWSVGTLKFGIGDFLAAVINFLIIGFVAWRISRIFVKPAAEAPKKTCPYCRMSMDPAATRCPYCTSQLAAA